MVPLSVLDLSPIVAGSNASVALRNTIDLARHAERLGYRRYWLAEHHNMPGIASAATAVVIGRVGAATSTIRIGAGGIMLPNHSPLVVAEQFGTLEALFPGRVDLGIGRAPGTDPFTTRALRREPARLRVESFDADVKELLGYLADPSPEQNVRAVPGQGSHVPVWILGSSTYGAKLAAAMGLPYAFASHFAPDDLDAAIDVYRSEFRPSTRLAEPYVMLGAGVYAADTEREAARLFTSIQQAFAALRSGAPIQLPAPVDSMTGMLEDFEEAMLARALACSFVGTGGSVARELAAFAERTRANEIIVTSQIFDHEARKRSFEILADAVR